MAVNPDKDIWALEETLTVEHTVRKHLAQIGCEENMPKWVPYELTDDQRLETR